MSENFDKLVVPSVPQIASFDRCNPNHLRSLAACSVQGVYNLERERDRERISNEQENDARATSQWCEPFGYKLKDKLIDGTDSSYFGAIYELKSRPNLAPRYVIAFRGTIIGPQTGYTDMKANFQYLMASPEKDSRFDSAFKVVWNMVQVAGRDNVWLAGHSLGASIALFVGRKMAMSHIHITTYLFNPPFISIRIERMMKNKKLNSGVHIIGSIMKAGIATALNKIHHEDGPKEDAFDVLSNWMPYIFVNPKDKICSKYIKYFQHRGNMEGIGLGKIEKIATKHSARSLIFDVIGKGFEPFHILPTANLTINGFKLENFRQAHGIDQWWQQHALFESKIYKY